MSLHYAGFPTPPGLCCYDLYLDYRSVTPRRLCHQTRIRNENRQSSGLALNSEKRRDRLINGPGYDGKVKPSLERAAVLIDRTNTMDAGPVTILLALVSTWIAQRELANPSRVNPANNNVSTSPSCICETAGCFNLLDESPTQVAASSNYWIINQVSTSSIWKCLMSQT